MNAETTKTKMILKMENKDLSGEGLTDVKTYDFLNGNNISYICL